MFDGKHQHPGSSTRRERRRLSDSRASDEEYNPEPSDNKNSSNNTIFVELFVDTWPYVHVLYVSRSNVMFSTCVYVLHLLIVSHFNMNLKPFMVV